MPGNGGIHISNIFPARADMSGSNLANPRYALRTAPCRAVFIRAGELLRCKFRSTKYLWVLSTSFSLCLSDRKEAELGRAQSTPS